MKDTKTMAYINMFAILGALEELCGMDEAAAALLPKEKEITILFDVKDGPAATFTFGNETCVMREGRGVCDIRLPFSSCEKFNGMIDGISTPIPSKGFTKIGFLTKHFTKLTDILSSYLKADEIQLEDPSLFQKSTELLLSIKDGPGVSIVAKDHRLQAVKRRLPEPRAIMEFDSIQLARRLFDGKENAMNCIGKKKIAVSGMISMLDNINRILDEVTKWNIKSINMRRAEKFLNVL